ncbi:MAG: response regulator, partial [Alphaproteobacteria bacterium]|nr:response regulator [Alphaproteobacteria bacterium]
MSLPIKDKGLTSDILVVDDETDIRALIKGILNDEGLSVREAANADETLRTISARRPTLIILDIWLSGSSMDGMQILQHVCKEYPGLPVIMISGHGNIDTAVSAIKIGAYDFIEKPFKADRLILQVRHALDAARLKRENQELKFRANADYEIIGKSSAINQVRQIVERVSPTGSRVLISGPSGCGKETVARVLHAQSKRAEGPFVIINCATMVADQLEQIG